MIRINEKGVSPLFFTFDRWRFTIVSKALNATCHDVKEQMTCRLSWIPLMQDSQLQAQD